MLVSIPIRVSAVLALGCDRPLAYHHSSFNPYKGFSRFSAGTAECQPLPLPGFNPYKGFSRFSAYFPGPSQWKTLVSIPIRVSAVLAPVISVPCNLFFRVSIPIRVSAVLAQRVYESLDIFSFQGTLARATTIIPFHQNPFTKLQPSKKPKPTHSKPFQPCAKPIKSLTHQKPYPSIAIAIQRHLSPKTPPYPRTTPA
jgi:hypothetical protein